MTNGGYKAHLIVQSHKLQQPGFVDRTSDRALNCLDALGIEVTQKHCVAKDSVVLKPLLANALASSIDLIVIAGGTGLGLDNKTPQLIQQSCDYEIPGIGEVMRRQGLDYSKNAPLGRGGAWVKEQTLILALSGNHEAFTQQMQAIADLIPEALKALNNQCENRRILSNSNAIKHESSPRSSL